MKLSQSLLLSSLILSSSCAHMFQSHARVVKTQPGKGGEIAIGQGFDGGANARNEARDMMASNCHGEYEIVEEGETVVGSQGSSSADTTKNNRSVWGPSESTTTTSTQTNITEWRMLYKCKTK